ncbi:MAG TPA: Ig-like domain-containing protein [Thermoanaerobaculia bacterium]|nr:Ig-like domain-containing protein [Thermoanaerobaculia bacterium]
MRVRSLVLVFVFAAFPLLAQGRDPISSGVGRAVLLAKNSIQIDQNTQVVSGDLVVNDSATSPILGEAQLSLDRGVTTPAGARVIANGIDIDRGATAGGDVYFNQLRNDGTIAGTTHTPLALPVFAVLPTIVAASAATQVVSVGAGQTVDVPEGTYSLLTVGSGGTARLTGNGYSFVSIAAAGGGSVLCTSSCTVAVLANVSIGAKGALGGADPAQTRFHAGAEATFGRGATVGANVYAPNRWIDFEREVHATGSFYARDIHVGRDSRIELASSFNAPPHANPQSVFTNGAQPLAIALTGSDPEGQALTFAVVSSPAFGTLSPVAGNTVTYTPAGAGNLEDGFTFSVTDPEGASGTAVVSINPPRVETPGPAPTTVIANDLAVDITQDAAETLVLPARAPVGVTLTYYIVATTGPFHGTLSGLSGAEIVYTPDTGYQGADSFQYQACGTIAAQQVCDTGNVTLTVLPLRVEVPRLANDITANTFANKPVLISLGFESVQTVRTAKIHPNAAFLDSAEVAGTVADANNDGTGDNSMVLPASVPVFMSAGVGLSGAAGSNGTVRMQFEWDISNLAGGANMLQSAAIHLNTHRGSIDSLPTVFYAVASQNDGALTDSDFAGAGERIRGGVMEVPANMNPGDEGTFTLSVLGELRAAINAGLPYFVVQGRVDESLAGPARGLEVRTSCDINRDGGLEPMLSLTTPGAVAPLTYTINSLPLNGTLLDGTTEITSAPYTLSSASVRFAPAFGFVGSTSFQYQVSNGLNVDTAFVNIFVRLSTCANDPQGCDNGR